MPRGALALLGVALCAAASSDARSGGERSRPAERLAFGPSPGGGTDAGGGSGWDAELGPGDATLRVFQRDSRGRRAPNFFRIQLRDVYEVDARGGRVVCSLADGLSSAPAAPSLARTAYTQVSGWGRRRRREGGGGGGG